jgi:hypothetical protein
MQVAGRARLTIDTDGQGNVNNILVTINSADSVTPSLQQQIQQSYDGDEVAISSILSAVEALFASLKSTNGVS